MIQDCGKKMAMYAKSEAEHDAATAKVTFSRKLPGSAVVLFRPLRGVRLVFTILMYPIKIYQGDFSYGLDPNAWSFDVLAVNNAPTVVRHRRTTWTDYDLVN
jgi:hypothetical protein